MTAALRAVGEASLSAAVMILAVLALRTQFQDRTPRKAFCLLWDLVMVRLLIPGKLPSPVSILRLLPEMGAKPAATALAEPPMVAQVIEDGVVMQETWTSFAVEDAVVFAGTGEPSVLDWGMILALAWLAAGGLLALGFLWSHLRSRRVYAASLPVRDGFVADWLAEHQLYRPVQVRCSDRIAAPLTYGMWYPVILLPRGMDWEDRETLACVLAHEHTHIRRFDAVRKTLLAAALCVHWFNPLAWVMYALAGRDIELACDEAVLWDGADRERYALALLGMEERRGSWSPSGSHFSRNALEERIRTIMGHKRVSVRAVAAVLALMALATTVFACAAPEKAPREETQAIAGTVIQSTEESYRSLVTYADYLEDGMVVGKDVEATQEFEDALFEQYAEYGLVYKPRKGVTGAMRYDSQPVWMFEDALPDGGEFCYTDPSAEESGLKLYGMYDEAGNLTGLMATREEETLYPSREEVQAAREKALAGMSEDEITRLNRNIIAANLEFEYAFLYGNVFSTLEDPDNPHWQYFDTEGEIDTGSYTDLNNYTAYDFADLIESIRETVRDGDLRKDLQFIADQAREAADNHSMACANELYKMIHDMDYFLLRYGPAIDEDRPEEWIQDKSTVEKFYGMLSCYD